MCSYCSKIFDNVVFGRGGGQDNEQALTRVRNLESSRRRSAIFSQVHRCVRSSEGWASIGAQNPALQNSTTAPLFFGVGRWSSTMFGGHGLSNHTCTLNLHSPRPRLAKSCFWVTCPRPAQAICRGCCRYIDLPQNVSEEALVRKAGFLSRSTRNLGTVCRASKSFLLQPPYGRSDHPSKRTIAGQGSKASVCIRQSNRCVDRR